MKMAYCKNRIASLEDEIRKRRLDSFLVTKETNVSYLTGFGGKDSALLFTPRKNFFITDSRYIEEAKDLVKGFDIVLAKLSTYEILKELAEKKNLQKMGFESMDLPYGVEKRLKSLIGKAHLVPFKDLIETIRSVKDAGEIELIKRSVRITKLVLNKIIKSIRPGVSENSLSRRIEIEFINNGAHTSFEPIVASGANSSKPHARPTDAKLKKNSFVMLDIGCVFKGYCSDITRTVIIGKVKDKFKKIYAIVSEAQRRALDMIRPGSKISSVDIAARSYIENNGFGKYFGHSLGHGVGMEVHEAPTISGKDEGLLKPGMVFTVEPAIYIPKFGGVRLEDMVLVTDKGYDILTR